MSDITPAQDHAEALGHQAQAGSTSGTGGAWAAVGLMITGFTVASVGLPLQSWPVTGVGLGIGAVGVVAGKLVGLMSQVH